MTPAEAAAFRKGLEAGARVAEEYGLANSAVRREYETARSISMAIRALPVPQGGEVTDVDWAERYRLVCFELCELMGIKADEIIADSGEEAWMLVGYEARTKQAAALRARSQP